MDPRDISAAHYLGRNLGKKLTIHQSLCLKKHIHQSLFPSSSYPPPAAMDPSAGTIAAVVAMSLGRVGGEGYGGR